MSILYVYIITLQNVLLLIFYNKMTYISSNSEDMNKGF